MMITSPIVYMGGKTRLVKSGLIRMFPKDINIFVDVFNGSGCVAMNVRANSYQLNDIDDHIISLYSLFKNHSSEDIICQVNDLIGKYDLPLTERHSVSKDIRDRHKSGYEKLRNSYNKSKLPIELFTLSIFSFSQMIRFNSDGEFNMPLGADYFSSNRILGVENGCRFFKQDSVKYTCLDFRNVLSETNPNTFYYCDPPYAGTTATYNENRDGRKGWSVEDELNLYSLLDAMSAKGIRWALSSVLNNKGKYNGTLAKWISSNSYHVNWFTDHTYSACGKGNSHAEEILITNYTPEYILSKPKKVNTLF